jgi:hypothetical protein
MININVVKSNLIANEWNNIIELYMKWNLRKKLDFLARKSSFSP